MVGRSIDSACTVADTCTAVMDCLARLGSNDTHTMAITAGGHHSRFGWPPSCHPPSPARVIHLPWGILAATVRPSWGLQIEYSLAKRGPETSGLLAKCADLGVTPVAHSPLAQGLLTDFAMERTDDKAEAVKPVLKLLQFIGALSGGKTIEQVWCCALWRCCIVHCASRSRCSLWWGCPLLTDAMARKKN